MTASRAYVSASSCTEVNAAASGESATILRPIFPRRLSRAHQQALEDAAYIIQVAFPAETERAICDRACQALGLPDPGVIRRILRKETQHPSFPLLMAALSHIRDPYAHPRIRAMAQWVYGAGGDE